jgi:hypothetical protein
MKSWMTLFSLMILCNTAGCATLFNREYNRLTIFSSSPVRRVHEDDQPLEVGRNFEGTAYEVRLDPNRPHTLSIETTVAVHRVQTSRSLGGKWVILDIFSPLIGLLVDGLTGAWMSFDWVTLGNANMVSPLPRNAPAPTNVRPKVLRATTLAPPRAPN